ncbi:hypothetical protein MRX96_019726 [Rhipicephalus microplus]
MRGINTRWSRQACSAAWHARERAAGSLQSVAAPVKDAGSANQGRPTAAAALAVTVTREDEKEEEERRLPAASCGHHGKRRVLHGQVPKGEMRDRDMRRRYVVDHEGRWCADGERRQARTADASKQARARSKREFAF